jgi:predicted membrane-bound spermidine synthase
MPALRRHLLPLAVFITGASVLIVEVLAVRVLSPFYGNTIFTVSSVISWRAVSCCCCST